VGFELEVSRVCRLNLSSESAGRQIRVSTWDKRGAFAQAATAKRVTVERTQGAWRGYNDDERCFIQENPNEVLC